MRETPMSCSMKRPGGAIATASTGPKPRIESNHLFQGNSEIVIVHQNKEYNLRITRNGKLILTK